MSRFWRVSVLWFCLCSSMVGIHMPSLHAEETVAPQQELDQINRELKQLHDLKNKYKAAATRHQDNGMRWQFMEDYKQEAKRSFEQADFEWEMVKQIQIRIDYLEKQKADLLKQHPGLMDKET